MNLKYYLRGLGTGILVTVVIMVFAVSGKKETLSDNEIRERAKALGMTEEGTLLADMAAESDLEPDEETPHQMEGAAQQPEEAEADQKPEEEEDLEPDQEAEAAESAEPEAAASAQQPAETEQQDAEQEEASEPAPETPSETADEAATAPEVTPDAAEEGSQGSESITIQIIGGEGSYTACRKLEEAGLIASASSFDRYLYDNGYDKRINVGTFEIPLGAEPEQIARILAGLE